MVLGIKKTLALGVEKAGAREQAEVGSGARSNVKNFRVPRETKSFDHV
jgi:hypothetical protein